MTRLCDDLSRPEDSAERQARRRVLALLNEHGGCALCQHRDHRVAGWGRSICRENHLRSFPKCTKDGRAPAFLLDEERLKQEIERERANGHR